MAIELRQQLKLTQQLVMTPQLQMAIKLLQLSRLELVDMIRQELEQNPALEESMEVSLDDREGEQTEIEPKDISIDSSKEVPVEEKIHAEIDWSDYIGVDDNNGPNQDQRRGEALQQHAHRSGRVYPTEAGSQLGICGYC